MRKKTALQRVDVQVAILVTVLVVFSCIVVYFFAYTLSYNQMIDTLKERVHCIAVYVDKEIPSTVFTEITKKDDVETDAYQEVQGFLSEIREISSAQYLYTATKNANGDLIYHIDGLPIEDKDFRHPGDLIEPEFQSELSQALKGAIVMPGDIKNTEWGDVFVAYYPIHNKKRTHIIGAVGLEFPAHRQYEAFKRIRYTTPFVIFITCLIAFFTSRMLFRRISNPHFKDLSNTDSLTGLKNRNAYDLDLENLIQSNRVEKFSIMLADLNSLKVVNDKYGHKLGDEYIKCFARALRSQENDNHVAYRIGGDEFAVFFFSSTPESLEEFSQIIKVKLKEEAKAKIPFSSVAIGYASADKLDYDTWVTAQTEADMALYRDKKNFYANNQKCDNRLMECDKS